MRPVSDITLRFPIKVAVTKRRNRQKIGRCTLHSAAPGPARVPRVARLLALAHHFEKLLRTGAVRDHADLARLGHVSRARISQVATLLLLAPDIQEHLLFLGRETNSRHAPTERKVRLLVRKSLAWSEQREFMAALPLFQRAATQHSPTDHESHIL